MPCPGDAGRGEVTGPTRELTENSTWMTHWGLTADIPYSGWKASHRPGKVGRGAGVDGERGEGQRG